MASASGATAVVAMRPGPVGDVDAEVALAWRRRYAPSAFARAPAGSADIYPAEPVADLALELAVMRLAYQHLGSAVKAMHLVEIIGDLQPCAATGAFSGNELDISQRQPFLRERMLIGTILICGGSPRTNVRSIRSSLGRVIYRVSIMKGSRNTQAGIAKLGQRR